MARREQFCDVCQKQIFNGHLARQKKRQRCDAARSRPSSTPVEHSKRVGDILVACGLDPEQLSGWNLEQLNKLPNIRNCRPAPHRHHTPWRVISDARLQDLPSLEDLLVNVARGTRKNAALTVTTEVWQEDHRLDYAPAEWVAWTKRILKGEEVLSRMLNMPMGHMITADTSQQYRSAAAQLAACYFGTREAPDIRHHQATANITPRGTRTEVHHDSQPHISTAIGLASRKGSPLKLWLLWPSTELRHLAACYRDTKTALRQMDHGAFLVQMPGDSVVVPPNSPHAVIALESCYLYGHTFSIDSWGWDLQAQQGRIHYDHTLWVASNRLQRHFGIRSSTMCIQGYTSSVGGRWRMPDVRDCMERVGRSQSFFDCYDAFVMDTRGIQ